MRLTAPSHRAQTRQKALIPALTKIAAVFDLDHTLVAASTGRLVSQYLLQTGSLGSFIPYSAFARIVMGTALYQMNLLDATRWVEYTVAPCKGIRVEKMWEVIQRWFDEMVINYFSPQALERLEWHREQGHIPVICTASSQYSAIPVARHLNVEHTIYTCWEDDGVTMTGNVTLPITWGAGKVWWVRRWAAAHGVSLRDSYCYSDHISDKQMLMAVGHASAVNPDAKLEALAQRAGWEVCHWERDKSS